jgi:glucose uptake protein
MREHLSGVAGGAIWGLGAICSFVAAHASIVGPAISYAMGQGATMVSAAWGVFVWREFTGAPDAAVRLLPPMFILFILGLTSVAVAPLFQ